MKETSSSSIQADIAGLFKVVEPVAITDDPMNQMLFGLMKRTALIAVIVFSAGTLQSSTCTCAHSPSIIGPSVSPSEPALDCCCGTECSLPGRPSPCGCQQAPPSQGLLCQSEMPSPGLATARVLVSHWSDNSLFHAVAYASPPPLSGVPLCVALCRFCL